MNRIKEARMAAGLSQKYVATSLGVAGPSVSNWEKGKTTPTAENLAALSALFGVSVDFLLGNDFSAKNEIEMVSKENADQFSDRMKQFMADAKDLNDGEIELARMFIKQIKKNRE